MIDSDELDEKFSIEGEVGFMEMDGDLVFITIANKYADAEICLYGAHVTSFTPHNRMDLLWMSPESHFEIGTPIRGGIPICFPWFGPHKTDPEKPQHGFGRLMYWDVSETASLPNGETLIKLKLCSSEETKAYWPHDFCAELSITVGQKLTVSLKVDNTSSENIEYSCALHSYFTLSAIENITIDGLQNAKYHSQLESGDFVQEAPELTVEKAETRHYYETESTCVINDPIFRRRIAVEKSGSQNTTVWNPWEEATLKIGDIPDDGYQTFICVETVNAFDGAVQLKPGESHKTATIIGLEE